MREAVREGSSEGGREGGREGELIVNDALVAHT